MSPGRVLSAGGRQALSLRRSSPFSVTFYRQSNHNARGDGEDQDPAMPNQDMGCVLIGAPELQHGDPQKTRDRPQSTSKSASGERNSTPGEQPEQNSARNRDRRSGKQAGSSAAVGRE